MIAVLGLDLSLTSTGIACIEQDGSMWVDRIKTAGKKGDTLAMRQKRLNGILQRIHLLVDDGADDLDLVVVEAPSYGSKHGSQHDRSGLWWLVVDMLHERELPVAAVSPQGRAKYGTGKGNAGKDEVLAAVVRRYTNVEVTGNDQADAVLLAAMGARHLGCPIEESLPAKNLEAMEGAAWPL